jgi:hypothetical protein
MERPLKRTTGISRLLCAGLLVVFGSAALAGLATASVRTGLNSLSESKFQQAAKDFIEAFKNGDPDGAF